MIKQVKEVVFKQFNPEEVKGVFLSGFDTNHALVVSQGVLHTDKPLREVLDNVYNAHIADRLKEISYIVVDIVSEIIAVKNPEDIFAMSPEEFGFAVIDTEDDVSGVLLPNTSGVADSKSALYSLKQKYWIHGQVEMYVFRTERVVVAK